MFVQSVDWEGRLVMLREDALSIDVVELRQELRELEASEAGIIFDTIITAGGRQTIGAGQDALTITLVNGYEAEFLGQGSRETINGNFIGTIRPTAGIFLQRELSLAFAATAAPLSQETEEAIRLARDHARGADLKTNRVELSNA